MIRCFSHHPQWLLIFSLLLHQYLLLRLLHLFLHLLILRHPLHFLCFSRLSRLFTLGRVKAQIFQHRIGPVLANILLPLANFSFSKKENTFPFFFRVLLVYLLVMTFVIWYGIGRIIQTKIREKSTKSQLTTLFLFMSSYICKNISGSGWSYYKCAPKA